MQKAYNGGMQGDGSGYARGNAMKMQKESMGIATRVERGMQRGDSVELWWKFGGIKAGDATGLKRKCKRCIRHNTDARETMREYKRGHRVATGGCNVTLVGV